MAVEIPDGSSADFSQVYVLYYDSTDRDSDVAAFPTLNKFTAGATSDGCSLYSYNYMDNGESLQNGTEALALCFDSDEDSTFEALVATSNGADQFLSYEGTLTGTNGDGYAGGETSTQIGTDESTLPPSTNLHTWKDTEAAAVRLSPKNRGSSLSSTWTFRT